MKNEVVWKPIPESSQELALSCPCSRILLCGTRGSSKTDSQIMMFRKHVGKGYGKFWRGVILDVTYKGLDDIIARTKRWFHAFEDGARFLSATSMLKWVWPTGEELYFRVGSSEEDYMRNFHGQEFAFIGINEITKHANRNFYDSILSCNRTSFTPEKDSPPGILLPPIPLQMVATTNPYGIGRAWVKREFIDPAPYGQVVRTRTEIISPITKKLEIVEKTQVALFSSYVENIYLSPEYIADLHRELNPNKKRAWLYGDWNVSSGGIFDDLWDNQVHVVERFPVPANWYVDRSFDWGSTHPFCTPWWAEANGEEVILPSGRKFTPVKGSIIMFEEWYGSEEKDWGTNKGLRLSSPKIAQGILKREENLRKNKWVKGTIYPGPADHQIHNVIDMATDTIAKKMEDEGVIWEMADKSGGSRVNGVELFRTRLEASATKEGPGFYVMRNCKAAMFFIPEFKSDDINPDDVDSSTEDHLWDAVRYRVLSSNNRLAKSIKVRTPN